jgi:hypothetical protein
MPRPRRTKAEQDALDQWLQARAAENQALPLSDWPALRYARDSDIYDCGDPETHDAMENCIHISVSGGVCSICGEAVTFRRIQP